MGFERESAILLVKGDDIGQHWNDLDSEVKWYLGE